METLNFAFALQNSLLIEIRNPNLFVVLRSTLQYSNTPFGLSWHSQTTQTPATLGTLIPLQAGLGILGTCFSPVMSRTIFKVSG